MSAGRFRALMCLGRTGSLPGICCGILTSGGIQSSRTVSGPADRTGSELGRGKIPLQGYP